MTAREYLRQVCQIGKEVERIRDQIRLIKSDMYGLSSPSALTDVRVQSSRSGDRMLKLIAMAETIQNELVERVDYLVTKRKQICDQIEALEDTQQKDLLYMRYVRYLRWEDISEKMHYSVEHCHRIHNKALASFGERYGIPPQ